MADLSPFAAVEQDIAAQTMALLTNATVTVVGGEFPVIFDSATVGAIGGEIDGSGPRFQALDSDLSAYDVAHGTLVTIREVDYTARNPQPDGTGWTLVFLEPA